MKKGLNTGYKLEDIIVHPPVNNNSTLTEERVNELIDAKIAANNSSNLTEERVNELIDAKITAAINASY